MKECIKCNVALPLSGFYFRKDSGKYRSECIGCLKERQRNQYLSLKNDQSWVDNERSRCRDKYYRLNYDGNRSYNKIQKDAYNEYLSINFPEKIKATKACIKIIAPIGCQKHHWSYKEEQATDILFISKKDHYTAHRFLIYDQSTSCFSTLQNELLDTKEKHINYLESYGIEIYNK